MCVACRRGNGGKAATDMGKKFKYARDNAKVDDSSEVKINCTAKK